MFSSPAWLCKHALSHLFWAQCAVWNKYKSRACRLLLVIASVVIRRSSVPQGAQHGRASLVVR